MASRLSSGNSQSMSPQSLFLSSPKDPSGGDSCPSEEEPTFDPGYEPDWAVISTVRPRPRHSEPTRGRLSRCCWGQVGGDATYPQWSWLPGLCYPQSRWPPSTGLPVLGEWVGLGGFPAWPGLQGFPSLHILPGSPTLSAASEVFGLSKCQVQGDRVIWVHHTRVLETQRRYLTPRQRWCQRLALL